MSTDNIDLKAYTFEEPEDPNFKPLDKGEYNFRISQVYAWDDTEDRKIPFLPIELEILDESGQVLKKIDDRIYFSQSAKFRVDQFVKCVRPNSVHGERFSFEDPAFLQHREGRCYIIQKPGTKEGMIFNEVKNYLFEKAAPVNEFTAGIEDDDDNVPF